MSENQNMTELISEEQRKAVFRSLVEAQDRGLSVAESRKEIAGQFGLADQVLTEIERAGIKASWPPLSEG